MNHFLDVAKNRYTTKHYDASRKISEADIKSLKSILRLSPSSINSQPWHFYFVSDSNIKSQLADASYFNKNKVLNSSHLVVFCVIDDLAKFEDQITKNLPEGPVGYYKQNLKQLPETEVKNWLSRQVYLSLGYFLSACGSMNIDSTPMEGIDLKAYESILKMDGYKPLFAVAIGYRDPADENQPSINPKLRLNEEDVITTL